MKSTFGKEWEVMCAEERVEITKKAYDNAVVVLDAIKKVVEDEMATPYDELEDAIPKRMSQPPADNGLTPAQRDESDIPQLIINVEDNGSVMWGIKAKYGSISFWFKRPDLSWSIINYIPPVLLLYIDAFMTQHYHLLDNRAGIPNAKVSSSRETNPETCANITKNGDTTVVTPRF